MATIMGKTARRAAIPAVSAPARQPRLRREPAPFIADFPMLTPRASAICLRGYPAYATLAG